MTVRFTERIPTVDYGYVEVEGDAFAEFVEAAASVRDHVSSAPPVTVQQAMQNLQNAGLVQQNPGLAGPVPPQQQQPGAWQPTVQEQVPVCAHGAKKWVPPGVSRSSGKAYPGFFACAAPQGQQCPR